MRPVCYDTLFEIICDLRGLGVGMVRDLLRACVSLRYVMASLHMWQVCVQPMQEKSVQE